MECDICSPNIRTISRLNKQSKLPSLDDSLLKKNIVNKFLRIKINALKKENNNS